jgi:heme A synthase
MRNRLLWLFGYFLFSVIFSFGFLGGGDGSAAPMAAFYSWGLLFAYLSGYNPVGILISYIVYLCILFLLKLLLSYQKKFRGDLVLVCFYLLGSVIAVSIIPRSPDVPLFYYLIHFVSAVAVVIFYLLADWRLAVGPKKPADTGERA